MITIVKKLSIDFKHLFFPRLCVACETEIPTQYSLLCTYCQYDLPTTDYHLKIDNELMQRFSLNISIENAAAYFHFRKGGRVQHLIHQLKYENKPQIGVALGEQYGYLLRDTPFFSNLDFILPVPLHPKKLHKRGYNQSSAFAQGLSKTMNIKWEDALLIRTKNTTTQTQQQSKEARFDNVKNAFSIKNPNALEGRHILLVDDVITSGATLEACILTLQEIPNIKISIAAIAVASY